jgi:hypothetical protein
MMHGQKNFKLCLDNIFKALEIQRNLKDRTVGYLIAHKDCTAELTVLI